MLLREVSYPSPGHCYLPYKTYFDGWACYWAKEEAWTRLADGRDACKIEMLTSQQEDPQCESICHTLRLNLKFWMK